MKNIYPNDKEDKEDKEIQKGISLDHDNPEWTESMFKRAVRGKQKLPTKNKLTLRLDEDIVSWFKSRGKGYQTRINEALREFVDNQA